MLCIALFFHPALEGYSVLSHEALIDAVWALDKSGDVSNLAAMTVPR